MPPVATSLGAPPSSTIARGEEEDDASTTREGDDEAVPPSMMIRACTATPVTTIQLHTSSRATIVMRIFGAGGASARAGCGDNAYFLSEADITKRRGPCYPTHPNFSKLRICKSQLLRWFSPPTLNSNSQFELLKVCTRRCPIVYSFVLVGVFSQKFSMPARPCGGGSVGEMDLNAALHNF
jgi:hypothetical protein